MLKAIVYTLISFLIMSCGLDKGHSDRRKPSAIFTNTLFDGGSPLNDEDMAIAVRICFAYRAKRNSYSTSIIGETFFFRVNKNVCGTTAGTSTTATSTLAQGASGLYFNTSYTGEFFPRVETDISGFLAPICSKVIQGDTPINYYEANQEAYEISFSSSLSDSYTVAIGQKEDASSPNFVTVKTYIFDVVTNQAGSGKLNGLTSKVSRYTKCANASEGHSSFIREYMDN